MTSSTSDPSVAQPPAPPAMSLPARFVGIIFSPKATFQSVAAAPRWLGMLVLIAVFLATATFLFMRTEVGRRAMLEQQVSTMESMGRQVSDEAYAQMEQRMSLFASIGAVSQLVLVPIIYLVMAGILFAVFSAAMGGQATFKQVYAVVVHSGAIGVVQQLFVLPINYARGSMSSPTNLAALLPMLPEKSFVTYLLGTVDVFLVWSTMVMAIGLGVVYKRRTQPIAVTLFVIYAVIALCIAGVRTWMGGS
jgi:hypothetical protein